MKAEEFVQITNLSDWLDLYAESVCENLLTDLMDLNDQLFTQAGLLKSTLDAFVQAAYDLDKENDPTLTDTLATVEQYKTQRELDCDADTTFVYTYVDIEITPIPQGYCE